MNIVTENIRPPIPNKNYDWSAIDMDTYDPEINVIGFGPSEMAAVADLMEALEN